MFKLFRTEKEYFLLANESSAVNPTKLLVYLCFPIFAANLEWLLHVERKTLTIKWPSVLVKTKNAGMNEEKNL